ncbi:MAG: DUF547 domain-containing protein [Gammaproteobacteria bacterium]
MLKTRSPDRGTGLASLFILSLLVFCGCTAIPPKSGSWKASPIPAPNFSHEAFDAVLKEFVDSEGFVDYPALQKQPDRFEQYYQLISQYSPDSHPELFATEHDHLAYWINAYNAAVIKIVLEYYPITSVTDVHPPALLFFLPDKAAFFFLQRPIFGGTPSSLYALENGVIRERFMEPGIHFALNCASLGCPRLPREAFDGNTLAQQLDRETRKFFSEPRNFRVDIQGNRVYLSAILDWYRDDFIDWFAARYPDKEPDLLGYVTLYLDNHQKMQLQRLSPGYSVEFVPYDWGLNDRKREPTHE